MISAQLPVEQIHDDAPPERLRLWINAAFDDALPARLASMPELRAVQVVSDLIDAPSLAKIARLPKLDALWLTNEEGLCEDALRTLSDAHALTALRLPKKSALTASVIASLASLPALRSLRVDKPVLDDAALRALPSLRSLRTLQLESLHGMRAPQLAPLGAMPWLEALSLYNCDAGGSVLKHLAPLTDLRSLNIGRSTIEGAALGALDGFPKLEALNLYQAKASGAVLSRVFSALPLRVLVASHVPAGTWVKSLLARGTLERLVLSHAKVPDAECAHFAALANLRELDVSHSQKITARGVAALGASTSLEALDLTYLPADDAALRSLAAMPTLRALNLAFVKGITPDGFAALGASTALRELDFTRQPDLRADTLRALGETLSLSRVKLWGCTQILPDTVAALRARHPTLSIEGHEWQLDARSLRSRSQLCDEMPFVSFGPLPRRAMVWDYQSSALRDLVDGSARPGPTPAEPHRDVFRACGTLFAVGGRQALAVYGLDDGRLRFRTAFPSGSLVHASASRDGALVAATSEGRVEVWSVADGAQVLSLALPWKARAVTLSPDGSHAVIAGEGVLVLAVPSGEVVLRKDVATWRAQRLDDDSLDVITATPSLERWSLADGAVRTTWTPPPIGQRAALVIGPGMLVRKSHLFEPREASNGVERLVRAPSGQTRALLHRDRCNAELWADETAVMIDTVATADRTDLSDDGATLLLPVDTARYESERQRSDFYDVDAVLAFARSLRDAPQIA